MNPSRTLAHRLDETRSGFALQVPGMHWIGTGVLSSTLGFCDACVGATWGMTGDNLKNTSDVWKCRDTHEACDQLLQAARADRWKVVRFRSDAIPLAALSGARTRLATIASALDKRGALAPEEPRPCLLLPYSHGPVFHKAHLLRSAETHIERLAQLGLTDPGIPGEDRLKQFFAPPLCCRRVNEGERSECLLSSQSNLWQTLCSDRASELGGALATRNRMIVDLQRRTGVLTAELDEQQVATSALEATQKARPATIDAHEATITDLQRQIAALTAELDERKAATSALKATIEARDATIRARDGTVLDLLGSTSWKATEPLRAVSRSSRRCRRTLRRAFRFAYGLGTGRTSHAVQSMRFALARPRAGVASSKPAPPSETPNPVSRLIRESKHRHSPVRPIGRETVADKKRLKVSVIAWDLAHNPLGRAYLIADVLRNDYDVEIVGATFPNFGSDIWKPLRDCSRVALKSVPGERFPAHFRTMQALAEHIDGDVLYVSKPRLPSLELAILAKIRRNRPIILDIDDNELSFFENRKPLSLKELRAERAALDIDVPYGEAWTRFGESLIPYVEQITVSNEELRKRFGGMVLPHIRDERDFNPAVYPRDAIRQALGFASEDKVILFAGTPRIHKGLSRLVAALRELDRPNYKLLVVGSPADGAVANVLRSVDPSRVALVPDVPFSDLPGYICAADLVTLLQDEEAPASAFQMPAKFTDALSMGIPVLGSNVPPLINLASNGLVELLGDAKPAKKIQEVLSGNPMRKEWAEKNRHVFLSDYSYAGNLSRLKEIVERYASCPKPVPDAFHDLVAYHRSIFSAAEERPKRLPTVHLPSDRSVAQPRRQAAFAQRRTVRKRWRSERSYVDDKLDIVFLWKQNDTGIYGRRQDMFVKYLAQDPRVARIFHFDRPVSFFESAGLASRTAPSGRYSHARLVGRQTLKRRFGLANRGKVRFDTFVYVPSRRVPRLLKYVIPSEQDYLDFLDCTLKRYKLGQRRTVLWVCPVNVHFPKIDDRFGADLVIADVIDDERQWPVRDAYREKLTQNYEEVLARSDLVLTNCQSVFQSMYGLSHNIHLLPNAVELLEAESKSWRKPRELRRLTGPVIGYVGNLDIARIDLDLLRDVVRERPNWNFIFIGSMHRGEDIRELKMYDNVHFLGVRVYERALRYIRHFNAAIIPHLDNQLTKNMNPLKLYVYHALFVPVVSTPIANIGDFGKFVRIGRTPQEFVRAIDECLSNNPLNPDLSHLRALLKKNSWPERVKCVLELIEQEFAKPPEPLSLVGPVIQPEGEAAISSGVQGAALQGCAAAKSA